MQSMYQGVRTEMCIRDRVWSDPNPPTMLGVSLEVVCGFGLVALLREPRIGRIPIGVLRTVNS